MKRLFQVIKPPKALSPFWPCLASIQVCVRRRERHVSLPFSLCFVSFSGLAGKPRPPRGTAALIGCAAARLHLRATGPYLSSGEQTSSQSQTTAEGFLFRRFSAPDGAAHPNPPVPV